MPIIMAIFTSSIAHAESISIDGIHFEIDEESHTAAVTYESTTTTNYSNIQPNVVIPSSITYDGILYPVTAIKDKAFNNCKKIESILIPSSIIKIGSASTTASNRPFYNCTALKSIWIEDGESPLELGATYATGTGIPIFSGCPLEEIYLGRNIIYMDFNASNPYNSAPARYGYSAFYKQTKLSKVTLGSHITTIAKYLFYGCTALATIEFPQNITSIGDYSFYGCSGLTGFNGSSFIETIGEAAFYQCTALKSATINSATIPEKCFYGCTNLSSIEFGDKVKFIENQNFNNCKLLTSLTIPSNIERIGSTATTASYRPFYGCSSLKSLIIQDGEQTLLLGVTYNSSTGSSIFNEAPIESVYLGRDIRFLDYNTSYTFDVYPYRYGCSPFYNKTKLTSVKIGSYVTKINQYFFYGCTGISEINTPSSLSVIGDYAFYNCSGLSSIDLTNITLGKSSFYQCSGLQSVIVDSETVPSYCFYRCSNLSTIIFTNNVKFIENQNFNNCLISELIIPESVERIGSNSKLINLPFNNCTSLKKLIFDNGTKSLELACYYNKDDGGDGLFESSNIEEIILGRNIKYCEGPTTFSKEPWYYGWSAFYSLKSLKKLSITETVSEIHPYLFYGCSSINSLISADSHILSVGECAFANCSSIEEFNLGAEVKTIGTRAFYNCTSMHTINIGEIAESIGEDAFYNCSLLKEINLGNKLTEVQNGAFYNCSSLTEITIPSTVITVGRVGAWIRTNSYSGYEEPPIKVFGKCTSLRKIVFEDGEDILTYKEGILSDCPIEEVYLGRNVRYQYWRTYTNGQVLFSIIDYNQTSSPFAGISALKKITIGNKATTINSAAFKNCKNLKDVYSLSLTPPTCNSLDCFPDLTKQEGTLYVDGSAINDYKTAFVWQDFFKIIPIGAAAPENVQIDLTEARIKVGAELLLTATVLPNETTDKSITWTSSDDVVASVENGVVTANSWGTATITASTVNGLTASCEVTVWMMGDVNNDGVINVADVTITSNYIAGLEPDNFTVEAADINGDVEITVTDAVLIAQLILNAESVSTQSARKISLRSYDNGIMNVTRNGNELSLSLPYAGYTAFQADLRLPDSVANSDLKLTSEYANTHVIMTADKGDNTVRLIVFSLNNSEFNDGDEIVHITLPDDSSLTIDGYNIIASDTNGCTSNLLLTGDGVMSGVESASKTDKISIQTTEDGILVSGARQQKIFCYTIDGHLAKSVIANSNEASIPLAPGLYVVNVGNFSEKIIIK